MNTILLGALALAATPTTSADRDWTALDREIESLAQAAAAEAPDGFKVGGWIKTAYRNSADDAKQVNGNDEGGIQLQQARIKFDGKIGAYEIKASFDGANKSGEPDNLALKDFFARWKLCSSVSAQMGNFKSPFAYTGVEGDDKLIFFDRSTQGALWSGREPGFMAFGKHGPLQWWAAVQNGGDQQGDELLLCGKAAFAVVGEPVDMKQSGCFGVESPTRAQVALAYLDDGAALVDDAQAVIAEGLFVSGPVFGLFEWVDYGDGFFNGNIAAGNAKSAASADVGGTSPWGVTAGYMFTAQDEAAVRYEDMDDGDNTSKIWVGYNRYYQGHAAKWQVNWVNVDSDDAAQQYDELIVGLVVSI